MSVLLTLFPNQRLSAPLFISVVAGMIVSPNPVQALQVQVTPGNPQLGETLSVVIQTDTTQQQPTVSMGKQTYPIFPLTSNRYRAFIPTTPLDKPGTLQIQVTGDGESKTLGIPLANRSFPTQRIRLSGSGSQDATEIELRRVDEFKKLVTPQKFWNGAFLKPSNASVSTIYGIRRYYNGVFAQDYYHRGVDYAGATGSPVVAPAAGRVSLVGRVAEGFRVHGNTVGIDHGQGVLSIMLHLSRIDVKEGDFVQAGQRIGTVGSTGASTGPHLHWGLYVNGISVDPVPWRFQGFE